jgi:hypothetical protein
MNSTTNIANNGSFEFIFKGSIGLLRKKHLLFEKIQFTEHLFIKLFFELSLDLYLH